MQFADGGQSAAFDLVIDALGVWSPLSRAPEDVLPYGALWTNVDWPEGDGRFMASALEQRYERARKMVGVLPVGALAPGQQRMASFFWSLKYGDFDAWRRGGLERWKDKVLTLWPETEGLLAQIVDADQLVFATYAHRTLGGVILGTREFIRKTVEPYMKHTGGSMSPFTAWVMLKGLETMTLRVNAQAESANRIAHALEGHAGLERVLYPGLAAHAQHALCQRQMGQGGTVVSFDLKGGRDAAFAFLNALQIVLISNNLGDAKSIVTHPATTTHQRLPDDQKKVLGITPGLVRLSVGIEDADDILADILHALETSAAI